MSSRDKKAADERIATLEIIAREQSREAEACRVALRDLSDLIVQILEQRAQLIFVTDQNEKTALWWFLMGATIASGARIVAKSTRVAK